MALVYNTPLVPNESNVIRDIHLHIHIDISTCIPPALSHRRPLNVLASGAAKQLNRASAGIVAGDIHKVVVGVSSVT